MLAQWSKDILEAWIGVYAKMLPVYAKQVDASKRNGIVMQGVETVKRMAARNGPLQVRTCCALLIGALADCNSLLSVDLFEQSLLQIIKDICDDFNWEVRKEICGQLPFISKYIGAEKSF